MSVGRRRIAVTGAAGLIGSALLRSLAGRDDLEVVAVDVRRPDAPAARFVAADIRDPSLVDTFPGVDTVVHLAFQMDPIRDEERMRSINVDGTMNVFDAAAKAGVRKVVYLSSGVAYGAHPDNPVPLDESAPIRPNPGFNYAEHKGEVERRLERWVAEHPEVVVTILRPTMVVGPGVDNFITRQLEMPRVVAVAGHHPPLQFVHVDDVVSAIELAIERDLRGAYNVAPPDHVSFDEAAAIGGIPVLEVPERTARRIMDGLWRRGLGLAPAGELAYYMYPWVLDPSRLMAEGWRPRHPSADALRQLAEERRDHVTVGRFRLRRNPIGRAVATVATALLILAARWGR